MRSAASAGNQLLPMATTNGVALYNTLRLRGQHGSTLVRLVNVVNGCCARVSTENCVKIQTVSSRNRNTATWGREWDFRRGTYGLVSRQIPRSRGPRSERPTDAVHTFGAARRRRVKCKLAGASVRRGSRRRNSCTALQVLRRDVAVYVLDRRRQGDTVDNARARTPTQGHAQPLSSPNV